MPLEGHWRRVQTPLDRRDKRLVVLLAVLAVALAAGGGLYAAFARSSSRSDAGCVVVKVASTMGGATLRNCGAAAVAFCRAQAPLHVEIAAACRRRGYPSP
jgi:hypothetical protein